MNTAHQLLTDQLDIWTAAETKKKSGRGRSAGNGSNGISVYGVKKLRELILQLAVMGKLVPQDPNDEPASELLKRIQAEKARLIAEGKLKKGKPLPPISDDEKPAYLPGEWVCARLADLVNILNGRAYKKEELLDVGTPVLRVGNLFTSEHWYYTDLVLDDDKYCNKGDLLFAWSASFGPFIWDGDMAIYHYHIWKLDLYGDNTLYKRYLYTFLLEQTQKIKTSGHGVMMIHMTKEKMEKLVVYIPPLAEQHRIVAKVDELMALCDQLETQHTNAAEAHEKLVSHLLGTLTRAQSADDFSANWQRIAAHFDNLFTTESSINALKQTLLQLAVMGKLVPQNPDDEPASELLKRIQAEKVKLIAEGKIKKSRTLPPTAKNEEKFSAPQGWEQIEFCEIMELISGQHLKPSEYFEKPVNDSIPYITGPADFGDKGPAPTRHTCEKRAVSICNDILVTVKGSGVGKISVVYQKKLAISRQLVAVRPIIIDSEFIEKLLATLAKNFQKLSVGIAIPGISREDILHAKIKLPPLAEQHRIVAKVDELMALCDQLKTRITEANQLQQKLADVVVEQAVA